MPDLFPEYAMFAIFLTFSGCFRMSAPNSSMRASVKYLSSSGGDDSDQDSKASVRCDFGLFAFFVSVFVLVSLQAIKEAERYASS